MGVVADTSFLVGIWRQQPWALELAAQFHDEPLYLPWVVLGEFQHGVRNAGHDPAMVDAFLNQGIAYSDTAETVPHYAELASTLQSAKLYSQTNQNDIWIAACAKALGIPLITRNERHFRKMPEVELILPDSK